MAAGVGLGDTVIIPDLTFIGTASAVRLAGADPILADIDPHTFVLDTEDAAKKLKRTTKAILPVHLNGRSADMRAIRALAKEKGLAVIEDAAEAIASKNKAGYLGTQSDAGCFSLAPTKIITSGQGGFVLTDRKDIFENLIRLKDHGRLSRDSDEHPVTGFNFKFTDLQASLALSQWQKLPLRIERVKQIDRLYREGLEDIDGLSFPTRPGEDGYLMWPDFTSSKRDELYTWLLDQGITLRPFWPPIHTQKAYAAKGPFPGAEEACSTACWLPCSPGMTNDETQRVITTIRRFFKT
jgi:dTDP-4-amino-4,6-dideoxygalactose transaminase